MEKLNDEELELIFDELKIDPDSSATRTLKKLFSNYYARLDAVEANRDIYNTWKFIS